MNRVRRVGHGVWFALTAALSLMTAVGCDSSSDESGLDNQAEGAGGGAGTDDSGAGGAGDTGGAEDTGGPPGSPCWTDSECKGGTCWTAEEDGFPGGYCVIDGCTAGSCPESSHCVSFNDGVDRCVDACQGGDECRTAEGYVCTDTGTCWPGDGTVPPGGSCGSDDQCMGGANALCITQAGFLGGYCVITDCSAGSCPAGSECREVFSGGASGCIGVYDDAATCRPGYEYVERTDSAWHRGCYPGCDVDEDCPGTFGCRGDADARICVNVSHECSANNHRGDCPAGQVCDAGVCQAFSCNDQLLEPNESQGAAVELPKEDTAGFQICSGDHDWFKVTPSEAGILYMVGIDSNHESGDLQVDRTDGTGKTFHDATMDPSFYHSDGTLGPSSTEVHSLLGATGSDPHWLHVYGRGPARNNYAVVSRKIPFQDGLRCTEHFSIADCLAKNSQGGHDASKLMVFPNGNPKDPFIGDGVYFENGLSAFGNPKFTAGGRLWGRRELVMAIRNAVHAVQQAFPGTAPLSIGDLSLPDGTTPEGHPYGTHFQGANADIAYYIRPEFHGTHGNLSYRQICCDASLSDWSCVDTNTSSAGYGTCVSGSESTHIVDAPRTALFMAKLAATGRVRVLGVEAKIEADIDAALDDLVGQNLITSSERAALQAVMATANDHGSWIWHFNHMHVSFKATMTSALVRGEGERKFEGPWLDLPAAEQAQRARAFRRFVPAPQSRVIR